MLFPLLNKYGVKTHATTCARLSLTHVHDRPQEPPTVHCVRLSSTCSSHASDNYRLATARYRQPQNHTGNVLF